MKIHQIAAFALIVFMPLAVSATTTVAVQVIDDGNAKQRGVGTLVSEGTIVINHLLLEQGNQYIVTAPDTGAELVGKVIAHDESLDLAIISVTGLTGEAAIFASEPLENGRNIALLLSNGESRKGTVHSYVTTDDKPPVSRVQHTALLQMNEFGAPLLNNCGEVAGISVSEKRGVFDSRLKVPDTFATAATLKDVMSFLQANNVNLNTAEAPCLSESEQLAALEQEKERQSRLQEEERKKVEAELEKTRQSAEQQAKELEAAELAKKEQEEARKAAEEALSTAQDETIEQQKKLEEAELAQREKEEQLRKTEEASAAERERLAAEKEAEQQKLLYYAIPVVVLLFILLIAFQQRRKKLNKAELEASASRHQLSVEQAKYETAQEELEQASATFSDIMFLGKDEDGNEHRLKVIGNTLARSTSGVMIGRSAQKATYVLNVPGVSREHLVLTLQDGRVLVEDLGSANGTEINGKALTPGQQAELQNGDKAKIGTLACTAHFIEP